MQHLHQKNDLKNHWKSIQLDLLSNAYFEVLDNQISKFDQVVFFLLSNKNDISKDMFTYWTNLGCRMIVLAPKNLKQDVVSIETYIIHHLNHISRDWHDLHFVTDDTFYDHTLYLSSKYVFKSLYMITSKPFKDIIEHMKTSKDIPLIINIEAENHHDLHMMDHLISFNQNHILVCIASSKPFVLIKDKVNLIHDIYKYTSLLQDKRKDNNES